MFNGSITALITPFAAGADGGVDEAALASLVTRQVAGGSHGLVPCGTTGEAPCLTTEEHKRVVEITVEAAAGRIPVIAGCGTNCTEKTIALVRQSEAAGASGLLVVTPYYNKPTQDGLFLHFRAVAGATGLALLIYNIPGRSAVDMRPETMARLYETCENIIGVKDATGDLERVLVQKRLMGDEFVQLSGDDINALEFAKRGGVGCISVTANLAPELCCEFQEACLKGDFEAAKALHERLTPLHRDLFVETNPAPVKYATHLMGLCAADVRLPLAPLSPASRETVKKALELTGLLGSVPG